MMQTPILLNFKACCKKVLYPKGVHTPSYGRQLEITPKNTRANMITELKNG